MANKLLSLVNGQNTLLAKLLLDTDALTANRTVAIQDQSGTLAMLSDISGTNSSLVLAGVLWGTPAGEFGDAIDVTATIRDFDGNLLASSVVDIELLVSDGAVDNEPSATASLVAAGTPSGTILAGSGTPRMTIRSQAGSFSVRVTEAEVGNRFLWVKAGGNARLWVRSLSGVLELIFT